MPKSKYGDEMKKVVRFIPKGQTEMLDIYDQLNSKTPVAKENKTFSQDKYFIRPQDDGYEEYFVEEEVAQKPEKRKKKGIATVSGGTRRKTKVLKKKKQRAIGAEFESKVVAKEKRRLFVESIKPRKEVWRVCTIVLAIGVSLFMLIAFFNVSSQITEIRYKNITLKQEYDNKLYEKKEIETKLESSNRSDRIEEVARRELGMDYPRPDQIVYIKSN